MLHDQAATIDPQTEESLLLDAAMSYASKGIRVFPVTAGQKKPPLIERWQYLATTDRRQIEQWWTRWPNANIGAACGPKSGIMQIDCDSPEAEQWVSKHIFGDEPVPAPKSVSPKGSKYVFQYHDKLPPKAHIPLNLPTGEHIGDVKIGYNDLGSYVIMPPSIHPGGTQYRWAPGCSLDEIDPPALSTRAIAAIAALDIEGTLYTPKPSVSDGVSQGSRNVAAAMYIGGTVGHSEVLDAETLELLWEDAKNWNGRNDPPLAIGELKRTFDSIVTRDRKKRGPDNRRNGLEYLRLVLDLATLTGVRQYGSRNAEYELLFAGPGGPESVDLGTIKEVASVAHVRNRVLEATHGRSCMKMNKQDWPGVMQSLVQEAEIVELPSESEQFEDMLLRLEVAHGVRRSHYAEADDYWHHLKCRLLGEEGNTYCPCGRHPDDHSLIVSSESIARWIGLSNYPREWTRQRVVRLLKQSGFFTWRLDVRESGKKKHVALWRSKPDWRLDDLRSMPGPEHMGSLTGERPDAPPGDPRGPVLNTWGDYATKATDSLNLL